MKGTLSKTESGWVVQYWEINPYQKGPAGQVLERVNELPLIDNGHIDGLKLYDSNEGLEVDFEIVIDIDNNGPDHFPKFAKIITPEEVRFNLSKAELRNWDVTLNYETIMNFGVINDGLKNEPYISDDFQIGPDGAYEHTEEWNTSPREKASELIVGYQIKVKSLDYNEAKQCVLVMVDQIKKILYDQDSMVRYDYWFEVKKEIEKL
jgi:hypothetical protein